MKNSRGSFARSPTASTSSLEVRNGHGLAARSAEIPSTSRMHVHHSAALFVDHAVPVIGHRGVGPLEEPGGVFGRQVDAAVASHTTEFVVPVGAVQRETLVKILNEGHIEQAVRIGGIVGAVHRGRDGASVTMNVPLGVADSVSGSPSSPRPVLTSVVYTRDFTHIRDERLLQY